MPRLFISYARVQEEFARKLAERLLEYGADVWMDVISIEAGTNWSDEIQIGLDISHVMLLIISPESMESPNVAQEWQYYFDEHKEIVPVLHSPAKVHFQIRRLQYIDFYTQDFDLAFQHLHAELRRKGVSLTPQDEEEELFIIPHRQIPLAERTSSRPAELSSTLNDIVPISTRTGRRSRLPVLLGIGGVLAAVAVIALLALGSSGENNASETATASTRIAAAADTATSDHTSSTAITDTPLPPFALGETRVAQTEAAIQTATATLFTPTSEAEFLATVRANLTATRAALTATAAAAASATQAAHLTATATLFTPTPTPTPTLSPTPTIIPGFPGGEQVIRNDDWTPRETIIGGVHMMFVPIGCYPDFAADAGEAAEICFDEPFYIDKTEVTNGAYGGIGSFTGLNAPREVVSWQEAQNFCASRNGRLPTAEEWTYAAAGPSGLRYPWGDRFIPDDLVYSENANRTADTGSTPGDMSWVGAFDMAGNVAEWTSSGDGSGRIVKGTAWRLDAAFAANDFVRTFFPNTQQNIIGFRCVIDYEPGEVLEDTLFNVIRSREDLGDLVLALDAAVPSLTVALNSGGPFTLFAPNDEAFENLALSLGMSLGELLSDGDLITEILRYHLLEITLSSERLARMRASSVPTVLQDNAVTIDVDAANTITLNRTATILEGDIEATNGAIHIISEVLLPAVALERLARSSPQR